jgi:putative ATP-dependent endonuclease of OLD family
VSLPDTARGSLQTVPARGLPPVPVITASGHDTGRQRGKRNVPAPHPPRDFQKLPGYDTLRLVLAEKVILVEGPTEELILQRAYIDEHSTEKEIKLPQDDGIDIITVNSLAFKRYCDIAAVIKKPITIVTDNDGSLENIRKKYKGYIENKELFTFLYETDEALPTIEPSVLEVNTTDGAPTVAFKAAISKNGSMKNKSREEILSFMSANKTEWAMRVFESDQKIKYPKYIKEAVQ